MPFQNWPYSDLGNINLDWILARVKEAWVAAHNAEEVAENLRAFVNDYFDNLDVQQEINKKIDNMVLDGSFEDVLLQFVPAIIDTWLGAHITNPTNPPLDSTLTLTNAAAQAKAAGDKIRELESRPLKYWYIHENYDSANPATPADMPLNSYAYAGSNRLGEGWFEDLNSAAPATAYFIYCYASAYNNVRHYIAYAAGRGDIFTGYTTNGAETVNWSKVTSDEIEDAVQVYTNFEFIDEDKVYSGDSLVDRPDNVNLNATKKVPCIGGTDYYSRSPMFSYNQTGVVFFDRSGRIIGHTYKGNFAPYIYTTADGTQEATGYLEMFKFRTPDEARYFAFNWSRTEANKKFFCFSNVPAFMIGFEQPDIRITADSPLLAKKNKTLCVIGPSGVMIDRIYRSAVEDYISGFQEHLRPFYKDVISYGYSNASYAVRGGDNISIYEYITQGANGQAAKNFSGIDEVLFIQSGVSLSTLEVGTAGGYGVESVDNTTMIGSIRGIVQYILAQNPRCKIYMASYYKYNNSLAYPSKVDAMHDALHQLCDALGLTYIDLWSEAPFNYSNYSETNLVFTYDGGHANSLGNKEIADVLKSKML